MNSVMDDNKLLTLPNGERIRLQEHCKLLFEVAELQYASPATISRCGMVYVDSRNLGFQPFIDTWLSNRALPCQKTVLEGLMKKYVKPCLEWVLGESGDRKPTQIVARTGLNLVKQLCTLLDCQSILEEEEIFQDQQAIEALFIWCLIWSVGSCLIEKPTIKDRSEFDSLVKRISGLGLIDEVKVPVSKLPSRSLFDFNLDTTDWTWCAWSQYLTSYEPPNSGKFSEILVPTVDTVR